MRHTKISILKSEFAVKNNWKDIYQWKRTKSKGNTELISEMILNNFNKINWTDKGLRKSEFKMESHVGNCQIQTSITQFTEKRFCRALFNKYSNKEHPLLGQILDYETPLTEPKQGKNKVNHGDIDIVSIRNNIGLLFIEAKNPKSNESILKALLEIFVYSMGLVKFNRIKQFKDDFEIRYIKQIVPCILTFKDSISGKQIKKIKKYTQFITLLKHINNELLSHRIKPIEFYLINKSDTDYSNYLTAEDVEHSKKEKKILLKTEIKIYQYFPELYGNNKDFEKTILKCSNLLKIEMLYRSYLLYHKESAIIFITNLTHCIQDVIERYSNTFSKNTEVVKKLEKDLKKKIKYLEAYVEI